MIFGGFFFATPSASCDRFSGRSNGTLSWFFFRFFHTTMLHSPKKCARWKWYERLALATGIASRSRWGPIFWVSMVRNWQNGRVFRSDRWEIAAVFPVEELIEMFGFLLVFFLRSNTWMFKFEIRYFSKVDIQNSHFHKNQVSNLL